MKTLIVAALLIGLGGVLGDKLASPPVEILHETRTVTVHDPAPAPEVKYRLPPACKTVINLADQIRRAAISIDDVSTAQLDLISQARQSIVEQSTKGLADVEAKQRRLGDSTIGASEKLAEVLAEYTKERRICDSSK